MDILGHFKNIEEKKLKKFSAIGRFNTTMTDNLNTLSSMNRYYQWISKIIMPHAGKRILDIGCANGNLSQFFMEKELLCGIDISGDYLEQIRNRFPDHKNFQAVLLDACDSEGMLNLRKYRFDTAITMNALEHIKDDILAFRNIYNALEPGAKFLIVAPAMSQLYALLDYEVGHYRRYNRKELAIKLETAGFRIIKTRYLNAGGAAVWFLYYTLLKKKHFTKLTFRMYNTLVPILRLIESVIPFPFGMSVIAIAEKPHDNHKQAES